MKFPTLPIAVVCLSLSACVSTTKTAPTIEQRFAQLDKNGDGRISRKEFVDVMITEAFVRYDKNGDGFVDIVEAQKGGTPAAEFLKADRSGSGKLTLAQALANPTLRARFALPFDEADVNKDGYITLVEYRAYRLKVRDYMH